MKTIRRTAQFKRDVRRMQRRGKDLGKLERVLESLVKGETLDLRHRDHILAQMDGGVQECHVEPDWLLIYELGEQKILLIRTGSHTDLFP